MLGDVSLLDCERLAGKIYGIKRRDVMNSVNLVGRLVAEPELKYTSNSNTAVCSFRIAVNRKFKKADGNYETDFINCVAWKGTAEYLSQYANKGILIAVLGNIQVRSYKTADGSNRKVLEVVADQIQVLEFPKSDGHVAMPEVSEPNNMVNDLEYDPFSEG